MKQYARLVCLLPLLLVSFSSFVSASAEADFNRLKGKWVRPDGGYVLEIKDIAGDGKMSAAYYNPSSIHVEKAEASQEDGKMKVFVELQDVNYPGSNYHLTYDPAKDVLSGTYFQAVARETYEIYFQRMSSR
jgi:hypothetical protein